MRFSTLAKGHFHRSGETAFALALGAIIASLSAATASAQDFEGQVGVASEYLGKGVAKSDGDPSIFGSARIGGGDFYASVFVSSADLSQGSNAEIVTAIGYAPEVAGFGLDLSIINRELPGTRSGIDSNYMEYQADVSRAFGPVGARLRVNYTPDGFASTKEAWWIEAQGGVALDPRTRATVAVGERINDNGAEYIAWNLGVKRKLTDSVALDVRWHDTDGHTYGEAYEGRLVGILSLSF